MKRTAILFLMVFAAVTVAAKDQHDIIFHTDSEGRFPLVVKSCPTPVLVAEDETSGARIAAENLCADFGRVCGTPAKLLNTPAAARMIIAGTIDSKYVGEMVQSGIIDGAVLKGKVEKYLMTVVTNPLPGVDEALVIAGSDMRGDGDTAMGAREGHDDEFVDNDLATIKLLEKIVANQRKIIRQVTGKPAEQRQQVWALYKEVQRYYDKGLKVPDDAIILLSDDNWGDIRRLPSKEELAMHKGVTYALGIKDRTGT